MDKLTMDMPAVRHAKLNIKKNKGLWAPDTIKVGDIYRLYYSASTFGQSRSAIRLVQADHILKHAQKIFLTYSASATDERYAMGMLTALDDADLCDPISWIKSPVPVVVSEPENGLFGPGHNSFTVDEQGNELLVFHARSYKGFVGTALSDPNRHCYLRGIIYDENNCPIFQ